MKERRTVLEAIMENELISICGKKNVSVDPVVLRSYTSDLSWLARSWRQL
ncbi:MAG: hypothetical protein FJY85_24225, partial [Deltaproteobacteria bacterium]|nr:hypothetical protein [Deltaproteobacteria bacterium]